jgi:hypothetical protein
MRSFVRIVSIYVILPCIAAMIMSQSGCGNSSQDWATCDFYWWKGNNVSMGGCQFPTTCDYNYIRVDPIADPSTFESSYRATVTVTPYTGTPKTWSIYPGSPNNGVLLYQTNCGNPEAWRLRLQRPIGQSFTVTLTIRFTCGGCSTSPGTAHTWTYTHSSGNTNMTDIDIPAPYYYGISNC